MLHACCAAERIDYSTCHIENERARCVSRVVFLLLLPFPDALHAESVALFFVHSRYVCRVSEYNYRNYLLPVMFFITFFMHLFHGHKLWYFILALKLGGAR